MILSAGEEYEKRKAAADAEFEHRSAKSRTYAALSLAFAVVLCLSALRLLRGEASSLWLVIGLLGLLGCGVLLALARRQANHAMRLISLYEAGLARVWGTKTQTGHTGEAYVPSRHLYARDLDVAGENSLFGMLATTRTALGHRALADVLLQPCSAVEATRRQKAVQELALLYDLREQVALLGQTSFEELSADSFERWLFAEVKILPAWLRPVLLITNATWVLVLVYGLLQHFADALVLRNVLAVLAIQSAICLPFRGQVREELSLEEKLGGQTRILRSGLQLLREAGFQSDLLQELKLGAKDDEVVLLKLQRLMELAYQRAKEWFYMPGMLLSVGTQAAWGLQRWKRQHAAAMHVWLRAWSQFDALLALSAYAVEHPENAYPEWVEGDSESAFFMAKQLRHPLLPRAEAVPNDITLDGDTRFLLISGSNMAGKSTLLRAIGANAVMAMAGLPVPAELLRMCALQIGALLGVGDSLAERKSKFLAEVERLRAIVSLAQENSGHTLFLVDEIFSGTNSLDRKAAAEAVLHALVEAGAVGGLTTHDLALTVLADQSGLRGLNVHMASPEEDNPMAFDYVLKAGVNRTTNAMAFVRLLGLAPEDKTEAPQE